MGRRARTPTILQAEAAECGATALGIVLAYHRRFVPAAELRERCGVSRDGSRAASVVRAARSYGLEASGLLRAAGALGELETPFIAFWNLSHFVVVEEVAARRVRINDPASGHRTLSTAEFAEGFSGVVLTFRKGPEFRTGGPRPRFRSGFRALAAGRRGALLFGLLTGVLLAVIGTILPGFHTVFLDDVLIARRHNWLTPLCGLLSLAIVFQAVVVAVQTSAARRLRAALAAGLASRFLWQLLHLPLTFYLQRSPGEVSVRQGLTVEMAHAISHTLTRATAAGLTLLFTFLLLLAISLPLAVLGGTILAGQVFALAWAFRRMREPGLRHTWAAGRAAGIGLAAVEGIETVKANGMEAGVFEKWAAQTARAVAARQELESTGAWLAGLLGFGEALLTVLVLAAGGWLVMRGELTVGLLLTVQILAAKLLSPTRELATVADSARQWAADSTRLDDVLNHPVEAAPAVPHLPTDPPRLTGGIDARGVTFGFSPLDPPLLDGFDLTVRPGEWVALVGASGCGKSTVLRVLAGLYKPWRGEVRFDGRPREQVPPRLLAASVGYLDQTIELFDGTIRDNLTMWNPSVRDESLWRASEDAGIAADLAGMPAGLNAAVGDGGTMSGGQRQRLDLARALATDPTLLLLDEPTSALDPATEDAIFANLRRRGLTVVVAAHRLSTIRGCDQILVLDAGRVVERGTHAELVAANGPYARLLAEGDS